MSNESANALMSKMGDFNKSFSGEKAVGSGFTLVGAKQFKYVDPVDGSIANNQGQIFTFSDGSRIIFRLSGTGSSGATIRLYLEKYEADVTKLEAPTGEMMGPLVKIALELSDLESLTGRKEPTVIT